MICLSNLVLLGFESLLVNDSTFFFSFFEHLVGSFLELTSQLRQMFINLMVSIFFFLLWDINGKSSGLCAGDGPSQFGFLS